MRHRSYSYLFIPVYILVFLLPILPLMREINPIIRIGESYTLLGFSKELLIMFFVLSSLSFMFLRQRSFVINWRIGLLLLFVFYGFFHLIITTASLSNAINNFRIVFLNVVLCVVIIFLYLNSKVHPSNRTIFYSAICVALFGLYEKFINPYKE